MPKRRLIRTVKQGDIFWCEIDTTPLGKHVERKGRPWIVISSNVANGSSPNVTVVPCSTRASRKFPTHVATSINGRKSVAMCEQMLTVDKKCLKRIEGFLTEKTMGEILKAVKIHLGMEV